jgi:hypothetical protein
MWGFVYQAIVFTLALSFVIMTEIVGVKVFEAMPKKGIYVPMFKIFSDLRRE